MTYRCPIEPHACDTHANPGYCERHPTWALEAVRGTAAVKPPERVPTPDPAPVSRPSIVLRLLNRTVPVPAAGLTIGRAAGPLAELPGVADLTQISRTHARLYWLADALYVADCDSTNGTFVDGERVNTPRRIVPGQVLRLGLDVPVELVSEDLDEFGLPR